MHSIELKNISKKYKIKGKNNFWDITLKQKFFIENSEYLLALNNISFSVNQGEIFGILGPNGAGKTTLIKIIAGLLMPETGTATINTYDIIKDRQKVRTSINILMSGGWIIFDYKLSVYDNLKFWGIIEGVPLCEIKERVDSVLHMMGLNDKRNDFPENLSTGLRQKMNLARCLLSDRPIYLLDEPTANVDPYSSEFIREHIAKLKKEGKTVILATHNLWEAELLCDRIAILNHGNIAMLDTTTALKKKIGKEHIIVELKTIPSQLINELSSFPFVGKIVPQDNTLEIYGEIKQNVPILLDTCKKYTTVLKCDIKESSLNDIFLQLMGEKDQNR
ncbi:MAG: ABC transporter ATP-binding protein [Candidatus Thermoplasmatota archaeon]